jgi:outer membrane biogenesis lipoprotein LolB
MAVARGLLLLTILSFLLAGCTSRATRVPEARQEASVKDRNLAYSQQYGSAAAAKARYSGRNR